MKSSIIIISNPAAKSASKKKIQGAYHLLRSKGYAVDILFTKQRGEAENIAREAVNKRPFLVIAAGGDGTFNEVINGMVNSDIPMAILPMGTTNVLAKEIGVPENVEGAIEIAIKGTPHVVSLGKIIAGYQSSRITRYFVLMAGIGYDGESVYRINENLKKISGKGVYILSGIKTLIRFKPEALTCDINEKTYKVYSLIVGKAAKYGGNLKITPDAKLTEPTLYVCLFKGKRRFDILRYVAGILINRHIMFEDVEYLKTESIQIKGKAHIQLDGDYFGLSPASIEVEPNSLRLIY
ncbi:MAG: diacylglycerol kinase family lipid kinase [Nitrospirae bacterium]|nr:diacylglycerol kinase family lipid kinase [Nitrospirota bacterium]